MQTTFSKRTYVKPKVLIEGYAVNEYVATCGDIETNPVANQKVVCMADGEETVFNTTVSCDNNATLVTVQGNFNTYYYHTPNSAATDIYDGTLGNSGISYRTSQSDGYSVAVTTGTEYVVWEADIVKENGEIIRNAKHANTYDVISSLIQKS